MQFIIPKKNKLYSGNAGLLCCQQGYALKFHCIDRNSTGKNIEFTNISLCGFICDRYQNYMKKEGNLIQVRL